MRRIHRTTCLALALGALLGAGCGSGDNGKPIPADSVQQIERQLDQVESQVSNADCQGLENNTFPALDAAVDGVPNSVSSDVRSALQESVSTLEDLATSECSGAEKTDTTTEQTETAPPETVTETVPTQTEPAPTETQQTSPDGTGKSKDKGKGKGKGGSKDEGGAGGTLAPGGGEG